jgi:predicted kinase
VVFTLDRWLISLFGQYSIAAIGHTEHTRRVLACRGLIWDSAAEFLGRSVDVVLDDGFFLRENRLGYVHLARTVNASATIHFLNTPEHLVRARLARRNAHLPTFNFYIDPKSLDAFIALFETPSADEGADVVVVNGDEPRWFAARRDIDA